MPPVEEVVKFDIGQWPVRKDLYQWEADGDSCPSPPLGVGRCSTSLYKEALFNPERANSLISNLDCFVDGPVSSLLDYCLGWEDADRHKERVKEEDLSALQAACSLPAPALSVIEHLCLQGCDVNQKTAARGEAPLHLLLRHHELSVPVVPAVGSLLRAGADLGLEDGEGNTPLLALARLLRLGRFAEAVGVAELFLSEQCCDVNRVNRAGRTLLSFSVEFLDKSADLTRLLINHGARVWPAPRVGPSPTVEQIDTDREQSAFTWFLRAVIRQRCLDNSDETLYCLAHEMGRDPARMRAHVVRTMVCEGRCPKVLGPVFVQLKLQLSPYWSEPQQLRYLAWRSVRRSLGPKRLNPGSRQLGLPTALSHYILLQSKTNAFRHQKID